MIILLILLMLLIIIGIMIFSFVKIIHKRQFRYSLFMLISLLAPIAILLNDYFSFKYPVFNNAKGLLFSFAIFLIPFVISVIYLQIKKNLKIFKILYGLVMLIHSGYFCLCMLLLSVFSGMYFYSYTTDINNYLEFDNDIKRLLPYDISYFPSDIKDKNVIEYKYMFKTMIDATYDVELKVKYTDEEYEKELDKIQNNEEFKQ